MIRVDPSLLLRMLPIVAGAGYAMSLLFPGSRMAMVAFAITKILDYSVRGIALELVYQPMPDRERLLGKYNFAIFSSSPCLYYFQLDGGDADLFIRSCVATY